MVRERERRGTPSCSEFVAEARTAFSFHKAIAVQRHAIFHGVAPKKMVSIFCGFEVDLTIIPGQEGVRVERKGG